MGPFPGTKLNIQSLYVIGFFCQEYSIKRQTKTTPVFRHLDLFGHLGLVGILAVFVILEILVIRVLRVFAKDLDHSTIVHIFLDRSFRLARPGHQISDINFILNIPWCCQEKFIRK